MGTSTQYPSTRRIGATVVPPAARSANPAAITARAADHSEIESVRRLIRPFEFAVWPAAESIIAR